MWHSQTTYAQHDSPLTNPHSIKGGHSPRGIPTWLQFRKRRVPVRAVLEYWNLFDEFGYQGLCAFAWLVELENGARWYIVRDAIRSSQWYGEPWRGQTVCERLDGLEPFKPDEIMAPELCRQLTSPAQPAPHG